jgi:hypothetical protein
MYQKDYILRMIEMLGELIQAVMGLIRRNEFNEARESLDRLYYDMLREDASFFRDIPEDEITDTLLEKHNYTNGHLEILAELFNAEAELELAEGKNTGSVGFSRKSLKLFEFISLEEKTISLEREAKMDRIRTRIKNLAGSSEVD